MKEALETLRVDPAVTVGGRFEIREQLGQGGMGIVYRAYDLERRTDVALKMLPKREPEAMYRLKQEFRALADVIHPNLIVLHELIATDDRWFFTMELIHGVDLVGWVCGRDPETSKGFQEQSGETRRDLPSVGVPLEGVYTSTLHEGHAPQRVEPREPHTEESAATFRPSSVPPSVRRRTRADIGRLRVSLGQLTAAISAIHEAGKLHLDLKPANVMVDEDGRVVVLDFGLARDILLDVEHAPGEGDVRGTPAYMAPEQAMGDRLAPAADWYAVGAILFRILTGQLLPPMPYRDAKAPSEHVDGVPEDLDALCVALLRKDPAVRAGAADVLRCVPGAGALDTSAPPMTPTVGRKAPFVGRKEHLEALLDAFAATRAGQPVVVYLGGRSGMGKTALAGELIDALRRNGAALVLSGRCYERESVPFKALDSVIDALADYLKRLPRATAAGLLPRGIHELGRLFPALRQVEAISDVPQRTFDISDDGERRRRAFAALKELLSRLVDTGPLVVFIDDLQWGDVDSARLLAEVLGPPDPPALLLVGTYRTEEERWSPALSELLRPEVKDVRRLEVNGLTESEAHDLARALLGGAESEAERRAAAVAAESEGNPFFVLELARHVAAPTAGEAVPLSLEQALRGRFERLGADALRLLEVVAVAGGPLEQGVAARAADLSSDPLTPIAALRAGHFVRTRGAREVDEIETYHDRIREAVVRQIAPEALAHYHLRLALELEVTGRADAEALAAHFLAVGRTEQARRYVLAGAEQASGALAFDKAARLYRQAIDLGAGGPERRRELSTKLGGALLKSGRGREAALAFLSAAEEAPDDEAIALKHSAAEQFLISGHVDEGMDVLRGVLRAVELPLPGTPRRALVALLARRTHLRVRGLKFRTRTAAELPKETLRQIDICFSAALGLSVVDWVYGASFQALQLRLALSAGEPTRIALGFAFEAGHVGCAGGPTRRRTLELVTAAEALSEKLDDPGAKGFTRLMKGVAEWGVGRFRTGLEYTTEAEQILRERCTGAIWQIDTAQVFSMICMTSLGDLQQLSQRHPVWLKEARERGDLYATTSLRTFWGASTLMALAADEPARARLDVDDAIGNWSRRGYHPQHYYALMSQTLIDLYEGNGRAAYERISKAWPALEASFLLKVQGLAITAHYLRGSAAIAAATGVADNNALLRAAARDADTLTKTKVEWSQPLSRLILAGAAAVGGDRDKERAFLESAAEGFDAAHMALYAAAARHALGGLVGGDAGRDTRAAAERFMTSQKIARPDAFASVLAPGSPNQRGPS